MADISQKEKSIVQYVTELRRKALEETQPTRKEWELKADLFAGRQDWGAYREQNPWMSKIFQHEFSVLIRRASNALKGLIFQGRDLFSLASGDGDTEFRRITEKMLRHYVAESGLEKIFTEYLLTGGIYGISVLKVTAKPKTCWRAEYVTKELEMENNKFYASLPKEYERPSVISEGSDGVLEDELMSAFSRIAGPQKSYTRIVEPKKYIEFCSEVELINPFNFCWLPGVRDINKSPFSIETNFPKFFQLNDAFNAGILDKKKRKAVLEKSNYSSADGGNFASTEEGQRILLQEQLGSTDTYMPRVETIEYFGPILDKDGEVLDECRRVIIANGVVVKNHRNPYWHQRPPYFTTVFSKQPFKDVGQGIADNSIDQQLLTNELISLLVDRVRMDVLGAYVVNVTDLEDETQIETSIRPGEIYRARNNTKEVISPVNFGSNITPNIIQVVETLKLGGEKGAGVDVSSSNPSSRARISASEVNSNVTRSQESVNNLADTIDLEGIQPVVRAIMNSLFQFGFSSKNLQLLLKKGILSESEFELLEGLDAVELYNETDRAYKIEIKGFKGALERGEFLSRVSEFMAQVNQTPEARDKVDFGALFTQVAEAYGLDVDKILIQNSPQDKAREENFLLGNNQMLALGEQDADALELPVHYELLLRNPSPAAIAHVQGHIQRILDQGGQPPSPPPEVGKLIFPEEAPIDQEQGEPNEQQYLQ